MILYAIERSTYKRDTYYKVVKISKWCEKQKGQSPKGDQPSFLVLYLLKAATQTFRGTRLQIPIPANAAPRRATEAGSGTEVPFWEVPFWVS